MKPIARPSFVAIMILGFAAGTAAAIATETKADSFDRLRSLVGEWEGTGTDGKPVQAVYSLTGAGSAVMEQLNPKDEQSMVTMFHKDGSNLMMTHYCSTGNQPRMRASKPPADAKQLSFSFVDATNLAKSSDPHMVSLVMTFVDDDHFNEEWTLSSAGKAQNEVFSFTRKK